MLSFSQPLEGISKASVWRFCLSVYTGPLPESMWNDYNQSLWVTCSAWASLYASHWTTGKWLCVVGMQFRPHACSSASANLRVDIKLNYTHITQDTIHFNLRTVVCAGCHRFSHGSREVYSQYLLKCHMGTIGLAVVVAAPLDSLPRLHLICFV